MKPSEEIIQEFREAYYAEFGEDISKKVAYQKFLSLTNLLRPILYPSPQRSTDLTKLKKELH